MEMLTKDVFLSYSETKDGEYKELYGLSGYPDMGGEPERVDVTHMRCSTKRYIEGLSDPGTLKFDFYYNSGDTPDLPEGAVSETYKELKDKKGKLLYWKLTYPDGTFDSWAGKPTVYKKAGSVGDAISFALTTSLESDIVQNDAPTQ